MSKEIDLVIIGDIAFEKDITKFGTKVSKGGSGYYSSVGASKFTENAGVVSRVGDDFDIKGLKNRGIDVRGIEVIANEKTAQFIATHNEDGTREFESNRGVAAEFYPTLFNEDYKKAKHIHFSTSLPQRYLDWISFIRKDFDIRADISVDAFELYAKNFPDETKLAMSKADIIFMNEEEMSILQGSEYCNFTTPVIIKRGVKGAEYRHNSITVSVAAPYVEAIDTTGAGDILAGAFLAQRVNNIPIDQSLEYAVRLASDSVIDFGVEHL